MLNLISDTTLIEGPFQQDKAHWEANDDTKKNDRACTTINIAFT